MSLDPSRRGFMRGLVAVGLCLALVGCNRYARVQSEESLKLVQQLYTACNTRNVERLEQCIRDLESLESSGLVTDRERKDFQAIIEKAKASQWEEAQSMAFQMAKAQVR